MNRGNITKAIKWIDKKLPNEHLSVKEIYKILYGNKTSRSELNKSQDNFVCCFVDSGYGNYYNIDNIFKGKVKAFPGNTPKERIMCALENLYQYCL